jgi:hypothetical protein
MINSTIFLYQIAAKLGQGGMGLYSIRIVTGLYRNLLLWITLCNHEDVFEAVFGRNRSFELRNTLKYAKEPSSDEGLFASFRAFRSQKRVRREATLSSTHFRKNGDIHEV